MQQYVVLSGLLFTIVWVGVEPRRNALVVFMCVELMLNASNLALVAFAKQHGNLDGQVAAFFVMVVAAAEVVVGLAIIVGVSAVVIGLWAPGRDDQQLRVVRRLRGSGRHRA